MDFDQAAARNMFDLRGKLAVVTGASRGIGLAIAKGLAAFGADIVGVSAQLPASGSEVEGCVKALGREFTGFRVDFSDEQAVASLGRELVDMSRPVDILVNNAGSIVRGAAETLSSDVWHRLIQVDLSSQFVLTRAVGGEMVARGRGKIIFTASVLSFQGGYKVAAYAASKSGVAGLTRALANEWAGRGVNVNAIVPGYISTDFAVALREDPERNAAILGRIPAGRWGQPADMVGVSVFLASPASDYVHGALVPVDGGWLGS
jgi:2-deoxy-D-gluconate 3-dehydrogenase